jgi:hypothetical protein
MFEILLPGSGYAPGNNSEVILIGYSINPHYTLSQLGETGIIRSLKPGRASRTTS